MAESAENSVRNIKAELREATQEAVRLNVQLAELQKAGAPDEEIAKLNAELTQQQVYRTEHKNKLYRTHQLHMIIHHHL